jgi:very-short-patch-repair endonuclease
MPEGIRTDRLRDAFLEAQGFHILRFWNSDIDQNLDGVLESIVSTLKAQPLNRRSSLERP